MRRGPVSGKAVRVSSVRLLLLLIIILLIVACNVTSDTERIQPGERTVRTDAGSIERGKALFDTQCVFCHTTNSTETVVGPGLKGILKKPFLPVSKKPSTPENVAGQMQRPYRKMPSFSHLSDKEINDIIAYLNTL